MQKYTQIPNSQTLQSSLALLLDNDLTAISNNSGTAFPTTNLQQGMCCVRTDQLKMYILTAVSPATWVEIADLSAKPWNNKNHGSGSGMNADMVDGIHASTTATAGYLLALDSNKKLPASITGDAATVAGKTVGNASDNVPLSNGTRNVNLNADLLDGLHAGNASGNVPISNGSVNANLNADMLDGYHSTSFVRSVGGVAPDANGNVNVNLSNSLPLSGGTLTGALTLPAVTVKASRPKVALLDTNTNTTRSVHHESDLIGFTGSDGMWDMYVNDSGQIYSANYGWLHDKFYNAIANCGNTIRSTAGSGRYAKSSETRLYVSGGTLQIGRHVTYSTNCSSNCNCDCGNV